MQDVFAASLAIVMLLMMGTAMLHFMNKSRCRLEEAVKRSGCSEQELRELVKEGWLTYRRQYVIVGPRSLDTSEIAGARENLAQIKEARTQADAQIRQAAQDLANQLDEANRRYQEQVRTQQEELERMRRVYDEVLKHLRRQLNLIPTEVIEALRLLGLSPDASFDEVRRAYRQLAKRSHPDAGGDHKKFIQINAAYQCVIAWIETQS